MAEREHDKIIAAAAKQALSPLGFRRQGRSRLWFADRDYWLSVVEFQPSGFSRGSYLNVAAHWLWNPGEGVSFNYLIEGVRSFIAFENGAQFSPLATEQAESAAKASLELASQLPDLPTIARHLRTQGKERLQVWDFYNEAVAYGLLDDMAAARKALARTREGLSGWRPDLLPIVDELAIVADNHSAFSAKIHACIDERRAKFGLQPLVRSPRPSTGSG